jgi:hypothetical protein
MVQRCENQNHDAWLYYGGRGITVYNAWRQSFPVFRDWALSNGFRKGLTIDRIDTNGNYEPGNCRWATSVEQSANRRNALLVTIGNETLTVRQWSLRTGIMFTTLYKRFHAGVRGPAFIAKPVNPATRLGARIRA